MSNNPMSSLSPDFISQPRVETGASAEPTLSPHEMAEILHTVLRLGILILRSGAASYRVETTMLRTALALGVDHMDAYITPTGIITSVYSGREHRTQIAQSSWLAVDLNRVVALELLSRSLPQGVSVTHVNQALDRIESRRNLYPHWLVILVVGLACGCLSIVLGGGPLEFAAATLGAATAQAARFFLHERGFTPLPITVIAAATATAVSFFGTRLIYRWLLAYTTSLGFGLYPPRAAVVASVLLLVPGVPLVTSILDLIHFDLVSGVTRGMYALILLMCVATGMLIILSWTGFKIL